jgi:hypothetical protein
VDAALERDGAPGKISSLLKRTVNLPGRSCWMAR